MDVSLHSYDHHPPSDLLVAHLSGFLAAKLGSFRKDLMGWTDKRVGIMSEIINGIQMIKFYAWEGECGEDVWKKPDAFPSSRCYSSRTSNVMLPSRPPASCVQSPSRLRS
jgi:hypothetical protein